MNITRENTGDLTATVKIAVTAGDYEEKVTKQLKDYQRKANVPGFRPGHVPFGMVKKMYGKALQAEEINKLISEAILKYIEEEKLQVLGNPIPNRVKNAAIDFEQQSEFDFYFDLGFAPEITLDLTSVEVERFTIQVDDEMVDRYVESIRKQYGKPEVNDGVEDAVVVSDDEMTVDEGAEKGSGEKKPEPKVIPAELTPELFDLVYPGRGFETLDAFREQIRSDFAANLVGEADQFFFRQVTDKLVKETEFQLPDAFLKTWLKDTNEGKYTEKEIEDDYPVFVESMKWQLIENKILKDNQVEVKEEDIRNYIKGYFFKSIPMMQEDPEMAKRYDSLVDTVMQNKEQVRKINDELYTARLLDLFRTQLKIEEKEIPYNEFVKMVSALSPHKHDHHHDHDHDHDHDHEHEHDHEHDHKH